MALVVKTVEAINIKNVWFLKSIVGDSTLYLDRSHGAVVSGRLPKSLDLEGAKNNKC